MSCISPELGDALDLRTLAKRFELPAGDSHTFRVRHDSVQENAHGEAVSLKARYVDPFDPSKRMCKGSPPEETRR